MQLNPVLLSVLLATSACSADSEIDPFFKEVIACPSPAQAEFSGWSKTGTQHVCKITHGPFVAWDNGYVHIRGQYDMGRATGLWCVYNEQGQVTDLTDFSASGVSKEALTAKCVAAAAAQRGNPRGSSQRQ